MALKADIGLEVHAELSTKTKIFCGCPTTFGSDANTQVCPVCLGMPGVLPVINRKAVEYGLRAAIALHCDIAPRSLFDRKNYYYPDLPKNYQISQNYANLGTGGYVEIEVDGKSTKIGIVNIHIEEDAGKNIHPEEGDADYSLVDFNRTGVPLLEIVSEPDMYTVPEVDAYMETLKNLLEYLEVSDCKMQEGSLRFEASISMRPVDSPTLGKRVEIKNLNSMRAVRRTIEYEMERQAAALAAGEEVAQETRLWNEAKGVTERMRTKEEAHDYRYFLEPDLMPLEISPEWIGEITRSLPELRGARRKRFVDQYGLPEYDAEVLTAAKSMADFFEDTVSLRRDPKKASNWVMGELTFRLNETGKEIEDCRMTPTALAELLELIDNGTISGKIAKEVFADAFQTGNSPQKIVQEKDLGQIADEDVLLQTIREVIERNPEPVRDFQNGKEKALGRLVGEVMKATRGKANPQLVNQLFIKELQK